MDKEQVKRWIDKIGEQATRATKHVQAHRRGHIDDTVGAEEALRKLRMLLCELEKEVEFQGRGRWIELDWDRVREEWVEEGKEDECFMKDRKFGPPNSEVFFVLEEDGEDSATSIWTPHNPAYLTPTQMRILRDLLILWVEYFTKREKEGWRDE